AAAAQEKCSIKLREDPVPTRKPPTAQMSRDEGASRSLTLPRGPCSDVHLRPFQCASSARCAWPKPRDPAAHTSSSPKAATAVSEACVLGNPLVDTTLHARPSQRSTSGARPPCVSTEPTAQTSSAETASTASRFAFTHSNPETASGCQRPR